jgi:2-polyprenyl-3-methyl-5-hydroxy-6-metoxy-1,4-benzoquinol methylase
VNVMWRREMYKLSPQLTIYRNMAPLLKDKNVLEVGYCTGAGVLQYLDAAKRVVGIEIDKDAVEFCNKVFPLEKVSWEEGDICRETIGLFDAIVMIEVIEHIPRWQEALKRVYNRLLQDGLLIISTPNANGTFIKNELHGDEWTSQEFYDRLSNYFSEVTLHDFSLNNPQPLDTRITPLVAVCRK